MRDADAIVTKVEELEEESDILGFKRQVLIAHLPFEQAKPYLLEHVTEEDWEPSPLDEEFVLQEMREYADFAWGKVINHRGISASRNLDKMWAFAFVLDEDELCREIEQRSEHDYAQYGAPVMAYVCEQMGFPIPDGPGVGPQVARMIEGQPCEPECMMGCGA